MMIALRLFLLWMLVPASVMAQPGQAGATPTAPLALEDLERMALVEVDAPQLVEREELPRSLARTQVVWLDREPGETVTVGQRDDEDELPVAAGSERRGLMRRLLRLLGRS